jgi:primosomal protein N' (replication factor Y)
VPVLRIDSDTTRGKHALRTMLDSIPPDEARILVGTQMLAKGHDLPNLTLVAVVSVDEALFSADFRATERLAQLIIQVAGRAGRADKPGVVWLQTHHPQHPLLRRLIQDGYPAFAEDELVLRRAMEFPPYTHLALLRAEAKQLKPVSEFMQAALAAARQLEQEVSEAAAVNGLSWHGPVPAPMPRRAGYVRLQLLLQAARRTELQEFLPQWMEQLYALKGVRKVRWSLDVDPVDLY